MSDLGERYEEHHRERRDEGDFVFVPERIPFFVEAIGRGKRVLDLGCRAGALTRHFLDGNEVVGLDVDRAALDKAAALGIEPVHANVEEPLPFEDESFDAVVAGELLEHLQFPDALIAEIQRVLSQGECSSARSRTRTGSRAVCGSYSAGRPEDDPTHLHMFSPAALRDLLAGFEDVRLSFVGGRYRRLHGGFSRATWCSARSANGRTDAADAERRAALRRSRPVAGRRPRAPVTIRPCARRRA